jgi:hypothetical protein
VDLDFARIECEIAADNSVQLTAALYVALRSFEEHFKASCCPDDRQDSCDSCRLHSECPYRTIFDQRLSSDPEIVRIHQKPSLPFSLYINTMGDFTSSCYVGMVVIGMAVNHIRLFHKALLSMVDACVSNVFLPEKYILRSYSLDYQGIRHLINVESLSEGVILLSGRHILQNTVHSDSLKLTLKSPLRLLSNSSNVHHFDFAIFFRSQLRRCSSLCSYYGAGELDLDFVALSKAAQQVTVLEDDIHYSKPIWSKSSHRSGLAGEAEFTGLVEPMFSLLTLGSYFNAGKGAAFGSGFHQIEVID